MEKNFFEVKAIEAQVLGEVYGKLQYMLDDVNTTWGKVGEKQEYKWVNGEKVYLWEDEEETIPKMCDDYGTVPKKEEDYTDDDRVKIEVIKKVMKMLEKAL